MLAKHSMGLGPRRHMVVAQIAYDNLSDKAKAKVAELIVVKIEPRHVVVHLPYGRLKADNVCGNTANIGSRE
jgi:hypothetical protein